MSTGSILRVIAVLASGALGWFVQRGTTGEAAASGGWLNIVRGSGSGASEPGESEAVEIEAVRSELLRDPDGYLRRLAGLPKLELESTVRKLIEDQDLLVAHDILESGIGRLLSTDLLCEVAQRASTQDVDRLTKWLKASLPADRQLAVALLSQPAFMYIDDPNSVVPMTEVYLDAAIANPDFDASGLTAAIVTILNRNGEAMAPLLQAKMKFVPSGEPIAAAVAQVVGRLCPGMPHMMAEDVPAEIRNAYIKGAAEAGVGELPPEGDSARASWIEGRLNGAIAQGGIDEGELSLLQEFISEGEPKEVERLAGRIVRSGVDPAELLPALFSVPQGGDGNPFEARLLTGYAAADPVMFSEVLSEIPDVPDEAVTSLISEIHNDPEAALMWSLRLKDPAKREEFGVRYFDALSAADPKRAEVVRATMELPW